MAASACMNDAHDLAGAELSTRLYANDLLHNGFDGVSIESFRSPGKDKLIMTTKFFGQYLIDQKIISGFDLVRVMKFQEINNLPFNALAIQMDFMTAEQVTQVHEAQKHEDLRFGDMSIKMGFLTADEVARILTVQRNKHVYLGKALVALGAFTKTELDFHLKQFHEKQKAATIDKISIPEGFSHRSLLESIIDTSCKLLTRLTGLSFHLGPGTSINQYSDRQIIVESKFTGDLNVNLLLGLSKKSQILLATSLLNDESVLAPSIRIQNETLLQFLNLLNSNVINKAATMGHELDMSKARFRRSEIPGENTEEETGLLFPIHLPDGEIIDIVILTQKENHH